MKASFDKIALGITDDEVPLGSHLIHFWHNDDEFERGVRFLKLGVEDESQYCVLFGHDEANDRGFADSTEDRARPRSRYSRGPLSHSAPRVFRSRDHGQHRRGVFESRRQRSNRDQVSWQPRHGQAPLPGRGADEVVELENGATALADRYPV